MCNLNNNTVMVQILTDSSKLDLSTIKIKKPYAVGDRTIYDLHVNNEPILIQTPVCHVPYAYSLFDNKYFQMDLVVKDDNFKKMLDEIAANIYERIEKYSDATIDKKDMIEIYKKSEGDSYRLRLKNGNCELIRVFDIHKLRLHIQNIDKNDRVKAIFQIERFIIGAENCFFTFKLFQLLKLQSLCDITKLNDTYLFVENCTDYSKYESMLKVGVPREAVRNKMIMDGLTEDDIDKFDSKPKAAKPAPPPPPPLPLSLKSKHKPVIDNARVAFLNDIKGSAFALKPVKIEKKSKNTDNLLVPSLDQILQARSRLKKNLIT